MVLLVKPDFPAKDLAGFLAYTRAHKNLTGGYGSGASQISVAQLQSRGGISLVAASYRGVPLAMTDVMAGVIDLTFGDFSVAIPQMQGGTLRGIGVTSPKRNELLPDLPALAEAMPGFESTIWYGLLAPAATPETIVNKIHAETEKFLNQPETRKRLADVGVIVAPQKPAEFGAFIRTEIVRWGEACRAAGIEPQ
jgi:tripartite-type tricarboxylate transporter receptor subunit TctC